MQYVKLAREDMSNFLFTSMTGTKESDTIHSSVYSASRQNLCWDYFAFIWTQLVSSHMTSMIRRDNLNWLGF